MGVTGLLPALKSIQEPCSLERYRGKTLAVDTYAWLHKGVFACSTEIVLGKPTRAYINYILKRIDMLSHFQITPYMVFDGDYLPTKGNTEKERDARRSEYKRYAIDALAKNDKKSAFGYFQKACDVTPDMAKALIDEFKTRNIKYIVAPYEADSQMVYLESLGLVDGVISEDSDLLIFGCKVLVTKLNDRGECVEVNKANFKNLRGCPIGSFNNEQLRMMATISGCDYTKGIAGIGIQKAISLVKRFVSFQRVLMGIKFDGKLSVPETFEEEYKKASLAFKHQVVFNPTTNTPDHLNPLPDDLNIEKEYLQSCTGQIVDVEIHRGIANGDLDPFTKLALISRELKVSQSSAQVLTRSATTPAKQVTPSQSNTLDLFTNGRTSASRTKSEPTALLKKPTTCNNSPTLHKQDLEYSSRKKALFTIDQFMKRMIPPPTPPTPSETLKLSRKLSPKKKSDPKLSPVAKRKKILFGEIDENGNSNTTSRFFKPPSTKSLQHSFNVALVDTVLELQPAHENADLNISRHLDIAQESEIIDGLNSSDFVLTDPDDDDDDGLNININKAVSDNDSNLAATTTTSPTNETTDSACNADQSAYIDSQDLERNDLNPDDSILDTVMTEQDAIVPEKKSSVQSIVKGWKSKYEFKPDAFLSSLKTAQTESQCRPTRRTPLSSIDVNRQQQVQLRSSCSSKASSAVKISSSLEKPITKEPSPFGGSAPKAREMKSITSSTRNLKLDSFKFAP